MQHHTDHNYKFHVTLKLKDLTSYTTIYARSSARIVKRIIVYYYINKYQMILNIQLLRRTSKKGIEVYFKKSPFTYITSRPKFSLGVL